MILGCTKEPDLNKQNFVKSLNNVPGPLAESIYDSLRATVNNFKAASKELSEKSKAGAKDIHDKITKELNLSDDIASDLIGAYQDSGEGLIKKNQSRDAILEEIRSACTKIEEATELSYYASMKSLYKAFRSGFPDYKINIAPPLLKLRAVDYSLELPPSDPSYSDLLNKTDFVWDPRYMNLNNDIGAIDTLLRLHFKPISQGDLRDGVPRPYDLLEKMGEVACDPVTDLLMNPEKYDGSFDRPPYYLMSAISVCPSDKKKKIAIAALESGWNSVLMYISPDSAWTNELLEQFKDSPFGKVLEPRN